MVKKSRKLAIFVTTFVLAPGFLFFTSKVIAQTNQVHCILDPVSTVCILDPNVSPNPDCLPGYELPCVGGGPACCTPQRASCGNVACVATASSGNTSTTTPEERDAAAVNRWHDWSDRYGVDESEIAAKIYDLLFPIGIAIGLFALITAGYAFMTSQGQPDKVKDARDKLTAAIVGILFIVLSIVILRVIIKTLFDTTVSF